MDDYVDELSTVAESVREILSAHADAGEAWNSLVANGFAAVSIEEELDSPVERILAAIAEETGRALSAAPYLSGAVVGASVVSALHGAVRTELAERLASGALGVLAVPIETSPWAPAVQELVVSAEGDRWTITGSVAGVLDGHRASHFLVPAAGDLFLVEADSPGVSASAVDSADPSRQLADLDFEQADASLLASGDDAARIVRSALTVGLVMLAAELVSAADEFLDRTLTYLKQRWAFGRPIGQFQAVKHSAVDLYTELAQARALLRDALAGLTDPGQDQSELLRRASVAKIQASRALSRIATRGVLLHGAIGFTWELGAHRFARRAMTDRYLFGTDDALTSAVAGSLQSGEPTPDDASVADAQRWLADNAPGFVGPRDHVGHFAVLTDQEAADQLQRARDWERLKAEAGFAGIGVPTEYGGQGRSQFEALTFQGHEHRYDLPHWIFGITHGMILPTILRWGTPEQKQRYIAPMLDGSGLWCQLFSEPGAGSDLAMASTRATKVDGGWRIQGQKVWNSGADNADFGLLVARTDPSVPKHKGLTVFILPMGTEGVTVRPIVQSSGSKLFSETFLDDVFVPDDAVVGEVGGGWQVAITTLMNERLALTGDGVPFRRLFGEVRGRREPVPAELEAQLVDLYCLDRALGSMSEQILESVRSGSEPGPEGSVNKLLTGRAALGLADFVGRLLGPAVLRDRDWSEYAIGAVGLVIGGGTEEIQKNVIAERVLGLPPEPRSGAGQSWAQEKAASG